MKKKINVCLIFSIAASLSILIFYLIYIFNDKFAIALHYAFHPEDFKNVVFGFEGLAWEIFKSILIFLFLCGTLSMNIISIVLLNRTDLNDLTASIKSKFDAFREKRRQKKIAKAKALLESEESKRDDE